MGSNPFNVPREREQQTFIGMMDNFFENLSDNINKHREDLQAEEAAYQKADNPITEKENPQQEVHVHIHTSASDVKEKK